MLLIDLSELEHEIHEASSRKEQLWLTLPNKNAAFKLHTSRGVCVCVGVVVVGRTVERV
jgi:hypothetical protein